MERIKITDEFIEKTMPAMAILDFDQARKVVDAVADAQLTADRAELEKVVRLARQILDAANQGDYRNGNVAWGSDEGAYMAWRFFEDCEKELKEYESKYIPQEENSQIAPPMKVAGDITDGTPPR